MRKPARKNRNVTLVVVGWALLSVNPAWATTWYVDVTKPCPGVGSFANPWCQIWRAFGTQSCGGTSPLQPGDSVLVSPGTYEVFNFCGKAVTVKPSTEPGLRIITHSTTATKVNFNHGETTSSVLDGFTITGGTGGQGIRCINASPTIRNCIISGNGGPESAGGGVYLSSSSAVIEDTTICKNRAATGAGIYADAFVQTYNLTIRRCRIEGNTAVNTDGTDGTGGGVRVLGRGSTVTISRCVIRNNQTQRQGGGIFTEDVGVIAGGCTSYLNFIIENSLVFRNASSGADYSDGGGISLGECTNATIRNCTITENFARDKGGGIAILALGTTNIHNSILWGDRAGIEGQEIGIESLGGYTLTVGWSDVQGGWAGTGNKNADPKFCGASADDYHLMSFAPPSQPSQVIDAGNNSLISVIVDYDNKRRKVNDPNTPDTGSGTPPIVDMGAYEYQNAGCSLGGLALACLTCKTGAIDSATPTSGTRDARQPHPEGSTGVAVPPSQRQGIGSPYPMNGPTNSTEPISVTLRAAGAPVTGEANLTCWGLCETGIEQVESPTPALNANRVISVVETVPGSSGIYQILLERPISGAHWTTIDYLGGGDPVIYASLPGDVNRDGTAAPVDILDHIDCCLNLAGCDWHLDLLRCDIDHSGLTAPPDLLTLIDLLNGAGNFIVWNGKTLPTTNTCLGGSMLAGGGAPPPPTAEEENRQFADWFVDYLATANPADRSAEEDFHTIVDSLAQWCVDHFTADEKKALAERLSDPTLTFASDAGAKAAADVFAVLAP